VLFTQYAIAGSIIHCQAKKKVPENANPTFSVPDDFQCSKMPNLNYLVLTPLATLC